MGWFGDLLKRLVPRGADRSEADAERLRIAFRARYHDFKLLLEANRRALEIMAEIEERLDGARPFGMAWVRARCTRIASLVLRIVRRLDDLAPGRYAPLLESYRAIQQRISAALERHGRLAEGPLTLPLGEITANSAGRVGGKLASLGEARNRAGVPVPDGFAVTAAGFRRFMEHGDLQTEIERRLQVVGGEDPARLYRASNEIQQLIVQASLPDDLARAILEQYERLEQAYGAGVPVAVRSSAVDEDVTGASLAGQYRSELNVRKDALLAAYKAVVASKYGLPAMTYRIERGLPDEDVAMCVGVLPMVDARAGGVLYSRNPLEPADDSIIINSAWGLPKPVVEGRIPSDLFVVARGEPVRIRSREIADKDTRFVCYPEEGICRLDATGEERTRPSLTEEQVEQLARLALRLERHYAAPQDVEWAIDGQGRAVVLQSRGLALPAAPGGPVEPPAEEQERLAEVLACGGITASRGAAAGPVFVVEKEADGLRFPDGAVLVTVQPLPRLANLLGRAAAVVAEHGSVAGHLANVAREFRVPALFGVGAAASRLEPGRLVTVDADRRTVYDGRVESLLRARAPRAHPLEGSPVHQALHAAARQITPLHLLDPDAPEFRPERCRTLHDITRFCHEKAVQEMFRFGKEHRFPERSSKQLYCDVPMQWWVLNLDDGFKAEAQGRYVQLDNVASVPMLALWEGITAVPWEGPPALDGRGFMSVMFGATTNTALTTGVRSRYADRNYFMISRDYCSLSSRLGAHFSIIEAMVGDRALENYISFQFKGGAADYDRRLRRVVFLREVLDEYAFRCELNEDNLLARLEGREMEYMKSRLRILGYLTIHTRQLDMVMARPAAVERYRDKLHRDIAGILGQESPRRTEGDG